MEALDSSVLQTATYPCNLVELDASAYVREHIRQQLQADSDRIFCDESKACVSLLEISSNDRASKCALSLIDLKLR